VRERGNTRAEVEEALNVGAIELSINAYPIASAVPRV